MTGIEAIIRLLVLRQQLDQRDGLTTGTLVSGYPGSPLGGVDLALEAQSELLAAHRIVHRPGVNEELALAAVWGSQMGRVVEYAGIDGVAGAWYGKTPGLDRSGDVLRHANAMGSGPNGGVVLFCGDDPTAKSSTLACESQYTFEDACVPVFVPGDQQDVIDLGIHAYRLSRYAGTLVGMKITTTVADGRGTVDLDPDRHPPAAPLNSEIDGRPWKHEPLAVIGPHRVPNQEVLVVHSRLEAARAYARANGIDRIYGAGSHARVGVVCAGKTYHDVLQAFTQLGIAFTDLPTTGVRILKLGMTYPVVTETLIEFARSADVLLVLEEKRPFIETQVRAALHEAGVATRVLGKRDASGSPLVSSIGELNSEVIAEALVRVLPDLAPRLLASPQTAQTQPLTNIPPRPPSYCSGCPHNRSTVVPEGALAGGGVGCHGIMYFESRQRDVHKLPPPPMGAEGAAWIGLAPFVAEPHLLQNLGDGTLSHSGILAIRACVHAGVNITFKILYNAAVAMTGGQDVAGLLEVPALTRELEAEGVRKTVVCSSEPHRYGAEARWAPGVEVHNRDELPRIQQELRGIPGVTVIIYDQRCAAEARRLRKRGELETPPARVIINEAVCEGCGDCMVKSNCASVQPVLTEFGPKKRVDDLSCNRDYTCVEGFCPSFVTITPKSGQPATVRDAPPSPRPVLPKGDLPDPTLARVSHQFGVYMTGIGGTGIVTANRILAEAAQAAGFLVNGMDQTGLSQKGGAVVSHLRLAMDRESLGAANVGRQSADLYLSGDIYQAAGAAHLERIHPDRTVAVIESEVTPTASMLQEGVLPSDPDVLRQRVIERVAGGKVAFVDSKLIADAVFSDATMANIVLLGAAFQLGALPFGLPALQTAFAQQKRLAERNQAAFEWGRWVIHDPTAVKAALTVAAEASASTAARPFEPSAKALAAATDLVEQLSFSPTLQNHLVRRTAQMIDYQSVGLARRFLDLVRRVVTIDSGERGWALTLATADGAFKLLTYKDEYEVARLHATTDYDALARDLGIQGDYTLRYHLYPPFLRRLGLGSKLAMGKPYALGFALLRRMKRLRGTPFDLFGWDADRRLERVIARDYEAMIGESLGKLPYERMVELAASAQRVKGYGMVKERNVAAWRVYVADLLQRAN